MTNVMITTAIKQGVPVIDAYHMASYNIARYYNMEHIHGSIATGRINCSARRTSRRTVE